MLSRLAVGYGSWTGQATSDESRRDEGQSSAKAHEGRTTTAKSRTHLDQPAEASRTGTQFPKTYLTRRGALILFSSHENYERRDAASQSAEAKDASMLEQLCALDGGNVSNLFNPRTNFFKQHRASLVGSSKSAGHPARGLQCKPMVAEHGDIDLAAYIAEVKSSMRRRYNFSADDDLYIPLGHREWSMTGGFSAANNQVSVEDQVARPATELSECTAFSPVPLHQLSLVPASSLKTATLSESWINYITSDNTIPVRRAATGRQLKKRFNADVRPTSSRKSDRNDPRLLSASWDPSVGVLRRPGASLPQSASVGDPQPGAAVAYPGRSHIQKPLVKPANAVLEGCKGSEWSGMNTYQRVQPTADATEDESDPSLFIEEDIILPAGSESRGTSARLDTDTRITKTSESRYSKANTYCTPSIETWPTANEPTRPASTMHTSIAPFTDNPLLEDSLASTLALTTVPALEDYRETSRASDLLQEAAAESRLTQHSATPSAAGNIATATDDQLHIAPQRDQDHEVGQQSTSLTPRESFEGDGTQAAAEAVTPGLPLDDRAMSSQRVKSRGLRTAGGDEGGDDRTSRSQLGHMQQGKDESSFIQPEQPEHFQAAAAQVGSKEKTRGKPRDALDGSVPQRDYTGHGIDGQASVDQLSRLQSENYDAADETAGYSESPTGSLSATRTGRAGREGQKQPERSALQQVHDIHDGRAGSELPASPAPRATSQDSESSTSDSGIGSLAATKTTIAPVLATLTKARSGTYDAPTTQGLGTFGSHESTKTAMPLGRAISPYGFDPSLGSNKLTATSSLNSHTLNTGSILRNDASEDSSSQHLPNLLPGTSSRCLGGDPSKAFSVDKPKKSRKKDTRSRKSAPPPAADAAFDGSLAANSMDDDYVMPPQVSSLLSRPLVQLSESVSADELAVVEETLRLKLEEATSLLAVEPALRAATAVQQDGHRSASRNKKQKRSAPSADSRTNAQLEEIAARRELARRKAQKEKADRRAEHDKLTALVNELKDRHGSARASASDRLALLREEESAALTTIQALQKDEDDARKALTRAREASRDERESRRQNEDQQTRLAKTKQLAELRQHERVTRHKQLALLQSIVEPEAMSRLWEDERRREEEDEWREEQRQEEEERRAMIEAEEEEARIADIEKRAEEEAMQGIMASRAEADKELAGIQLKIKQLLDELEQQRKAMEVEEQRLTERLRAFLDEERLKEEEDRRRAQTMARLEQETRDRLRREAELRRQHIMALRKKNLDAKANLSTIRRNQGINKAWVFSYYVRWPRETQERLIGSEKNEGNTGQEQLSSQT